MKIRSQFGWAALAAVLLIPSAWAQGAAAGPEKIGILNMQVAITSTAEGEQASSELQAQFAPPQAELETIRKQIEDIQTRLRNGASTLSDDEKQRLVRENDQLTRGYQRKQQDFNDDEDFCDDEDYDSDEFEEEDDDMSLTKVHLHDLSTLRHLYRFGLLGARKGMFFDIPC